MDGRDNRRAFLTMAGASVLLACKKEEREQASTGTQPAPVLNAAEPKRDDKDKKDEKENEEVGATEDLMREHGVIRRVLVVYRESAARLRTKGGTVPPEALQKAAKLIRSFGEDYHEKQLEEANIFPALMKSPGPLGGMVNTLIAQHQRGREVTDYILAVTQKTIAPAAAEPLARVLESFARMYEAHAAEEDTIIFPAWKKALSPKELDKMGDLFEDIEHKTFGKDGFDDAVDQIGAIEKMLGIELAALTAPAPPKV